MRTVLDIIFMNCSKEYDAPVITREVLPDNPNTHKPSDHLVPLARPKKGKSTRKRNSYKEISYRPLPDSSVRAFVT